MVQDIEKTSIESHNDHEAKSHDRIERLAKSTDLEPEPKVDKSSESRDSTDTIEEIGEELIGGANDPRKLRSNASSIPGQIVVVPREKRRGLLARFTLIPEVENPQLYGRRTKWIITSFVALEGAAGPMASAIFIPSLSQVAKDLNTPPKVANLSVAMYMLSLAIFPLWWSSFSETLGRRSIYLTSFALFTLFSITSALSTSIAMLIIMRILSGGAAASVQAVGAGSIADMWEPKERGQAMGIFYLGPLAGPLIAPIIGGGLSQAWNWRATQWFQAIYGSVAFILITLFIPETLVFNKDTNQTQSTSLAGNETLGAAELALTRVSTRQSINIKTKRFAKVFKRCIVDPLAVLAYLRFPPVFLVVFLASVAFGSLYILNISIQDTFSASPYDFSVSIVGLLYIPPSLGYLVASLVGGRWSDTLMIASAKRANRYDPRTGKLIYYPEDRLNLNAYIAAFLFPCSLLIYGWTAHFSTPWPIPILINFFFGVGSMIIFGVSTTILTEYMTKKSSSGVAVNNFLRNVFSCAGGVIAEPLISRIGNGWLFTGLAVIGWISAFGVVIAMRKFGAGWRARMVQELDE